jgi:hypothetical protein
VFEYQIHLLTKSLKTERERERASERDRKRTTVTTHNNFFFELPAVAKYESRESAAAALATGL